MTQELLTRQSHYGLIPKNKKPQNLDYIKNSETLRAGEEGLEPPFTVLETVALPLNYSPLVSFLCPHPST